MPEKLEQTPEMKVYNAFMISLKSVPKEDLRTLIMKGRCPNPTQYMIGVPMGMHHCPLCGVMVVAGLYHTPYVWHGDSFEEGYADIETTEETDQ